MNELKLVGVIKYIVTSFNWYQIETKDSQLQSFRFHSQLIIISNLNNPTIL